METILNDEPKADSYIDTSATPFSNKDKSLRNFEINQNYLQQLNNDKIVLEEVFKTQNLSNFSDTLWHNLERDTGVKNVQNKESSKNQSVETETKTDNKFALPLKRKKPFTVRAILDNDKTDGINQTDISANSVNIIADIVKQKGRNVENNNVENDIKEAFETKGAAQIDTVWSLNESPYTQIADKTGVSEDVDNTNQIVEAESIFPTIFGSLQKEKGKRSKSQFSNFESKIDEIKKRKNGEKIHNTETTEEKKVRRRKQDRPQPINFKQRAFETGFDNGIMENSCASPSADLNIGKLEIDLYDECSEQSGRKSKRKQIVTKRHLQYDSGSDSDGSSEIKQSPLCSKLRKPESRKSPLFPKKNVERFIDFEETSQSQSEDSNIPCTTNRYRRHFLKQLRNSEAAKSKLPNVTIAHDNHSTNIDYANYDSEDDYLFDGKRIKISELEESLDSNKCKVCGKEFNDIGMLMAHFICHSSFEKEQANILQSQQINNGLNILESAEMSSSALKVGESVSTYFCHLCNQNFTDISKLQEHILEHSANFTSKQQGHFECNFCQKTFATQGSLYLHKKIHSGDNPYTCLECHKHFRDKTRLTTHMRVHTGEKPYSCEHCSKQFSQKGNLKLHQQKIHLGLKRGKNKCKQCGVYFAEKKDLLEHVKNRHNEKSDTNVDYTEMKVQDDHSLSVNNETEDDHSLSVNNETEDDQSGKELMVKTTATMATEGRGPENDQASVEDIINFSKLLADGREMDESVPMIKNKLGISDSSLSRTSGMLDGDSHKTSLIDFKGIFGSLSGDKSPSMVSPNASKLAKFTCPVCHLPFQTATSFNQHFLTHGTSLSSYRPVGIGFSMIAQSGSEFPSGVKKVYRCEECSLDFVSFPEFQCHLKSHKDNNSKVMCNICQKQMSSSNLLDHMRIHTGEKPYGCIHCGKLFRRSHHLQTHLRTHTGDRPYVCTDCGKTFARGDHLQNHRRTHTGEKPYKCEICEKSYSQSHHLLRHKRTHTGEKPYNCELCDKRFSRDHHLKKHMETHRVVIYTQDKEGASQKNTGKQTSISNNFKIELPSTPMSTRGSDRIAQLLSSSWYSNLASGMMADIVQKHLSTKVNEEMMNQFSKVNEGMTDELTNMNEVMVNEGMTNELGNVNEEMMNQFAKVNKIMTDELANVNEVMANGLAKVNEGMTDELANKNQVMVNEGMTNELGNVNEEMINEFGEVNKEVTNELANRNEMTKLKQSENEPPSLEDTSECVADADLSKNSEIDTRENDNTWKGHERIKTLKHDLNGDERLEMENEPNEDLLSDVGNDIEYETSESRSAIAEERKLSYDIGFMENGNEPDDKETEMIRSETDTDRKREDKSIPNAAKVEEFTHEMNDIITKTDKEISFVNQLRAISSAKNLAEIVQNRINEDFDVFDNSEN